MDAQRVHQQLDWILASAVFADAERARCFLRSVVGRKLETCYRPHRHHEFLRFFDEIEANLPSGVDVHLVMDNYGTHKGARVRGWLKRHPRYQVHCHRARTCRVTIPQQLADSPRFSDLNLESDRLPFTIQPGVGDPGRCRIRGGEIGRFTGARCGARPPATLVDDPKKLQDTSTIALGALALAPETAINPFEVKT